ncbi:MAG: DUF6036 family nucleotidyltransferase [Nitrososphaeraceae archaeon]
MSLDKNRLFEFLEEIDKELDFEITLVAVGGTALTLLDVKPSTIDIDFTVPNYFEEFRDFLLTLSHGFKIDLYHDSMVFTQILPEDYLKKSKLIKTPQLKKISLRSLDPIDIVVTKIGRLNDRDKQDIDICIKNFRLKKADIIKRANSVEHADSEDNYQANLQIVLNTLFRM